MTGAGSKVGIGRTTCLRFAQEGAAAVVASGTFLFAFSLYLECSLIVYRDRARLCFLTGCLLTCLDLVDTNLPALKAEIERLTGGKTICVTVKADASDESSIKSLVDSTMAQFGRLDVFFANGAIVGTPTHFKDTTADQFLRTLKINTVSVFLALKYASAAMQVTSAAKPVPNGSIIGTASVAGIRSGAGSTDYSASKAAVINIMQSGLALVGKFGLEGLILSGFVDHRRLLLSPAQPEPGSLEGLGFVATRYARVL